MHGVGGGEGVVEVGVDVVGGEGDELAPTPKDLAEEEEVVEGVCEASKEPNHKASVTNLFHAEHDRRAWWEVAVAGREEDVG